jgi:hypothetical protein
MCRMRILLLGIDVQNRCHDLRSLHEPLSRVDMEGGSVHVYIIPWRSRQIRTFFGNRHRLLLSHEPMEKKGREDDLSRNISASYIVLERLGESLIS